MNKRWSHACLCLSTVSLFTLPQVALANTASSPTPQINVYLDGREQHFDVKPYLKNNHRMLPMRALFEAMGAQVSWSAEHPQKVVATKDNATIELTIGEQQATVNGQPVMMQEPAEIKNGRVFLEAGFFEPALGSIITVKRNKNGDYEENVVTNVFPAGQLDHSQVLNMQSYYDITSLDPDYAQNSRDQDMLAQVGEGLTRLDANGLPIPGVAKTWSVSKDGLTYTFDLRHDAKWSDGSDLTAEDFVYAWKRMLSPDNDFANAYQLTGIQGATDYNHGKGSADQVAVKALDDHTLQVELTAPMPYFLTQVALVPFYPLKQSFVENVKGQYGDDAGDTLYNGPFVMRLWHPGFEVLTKNPYYWDKDTVKLNAFTNRVLYYRNDAEAAYQMGMIDRMFVSHEQYDRLKTAPDFQTLPQLLTRYLSFNEKTAVLQNANIRKALAYAVDQTQIVNDVDNGSTVATGIVPTGTADGTGGDFRTDNGDVLDRQDNAGKAKDLLNLGMSQLGLTTFPKMTLLIGNTDTIKKEASDLQAAWKHTLGIDMDIKAVTDDEFQTLEHQGNFDISTDGWGADYNDPMTFLDLFTTGHAYNTGSYSNTQFDDLIAKAKAEVDPTQRLQEMKQAEKMLMNDMPVAPLYFQSYSNMTKPYVKGLITQPFGIDYDLKNVYIDGE